MKSPLNLPRNLLTRKWHSMYEQVDENLLAQLTFDIFVDSINGIHYNL